MSDFETALANLRAELWMVVGDAAHRLHWYWFRQRAYRKAVDAVKSTKDQ